MASSVDAVIAGTQSEPSGEPEAERARAWPSWLEARQPAQPVIDRRRIVGLAAMIGAALIAVALACGGLVIWTLRADIIRDASLDMAHLGFVLAEQTSRFVQVVDLQLQEVQARVDTLDVRTPEQFRSRLGDVATRMQLRNYTLAGSSVDSVVLLDLNGAVVNTSAESTRWPASFAGQDFFNELKSQPGSGVIVGRPVIDAARGVTMLYVARRLSASDGTFLGVAAGAIDVERLVDFYHAVGENQHVALTLLRRDGVVLARYPAVDRLIGTALPTTSSWHEQVAAGGGTFRLRDYISAIPSVVAVNVVRDYPLVIDASVRGDDALASWRREALAIGGCVIGGVMVLAVLLFVIVRQLRRQGQHNAALLLTTGALVESERRLRDYAELASDWFWEQDADLRFVLITAGAPVSGRGGDPNYRGKTRWELAGADLDDPHWAGHRATLLARQPFRNFRYQRSSPDGRIHYMTISGTPVFDGTGTFVGYRGTGREITGEVEAEHALRQAKDRAERAEALLQDAVDSISAGFVIFDADDRLVICNEAFRRIYRENRGLMHPGVRFIDLLRNGIASGAFPDAVGREQEWITERMEHRRNPTGTIERRLADGSWVLITEQRMKNGGIAGLRIDISALKAAQAALQKSRESLDRAQEIAGVGSWEFDPLTHEAVWSRQMYRLRGVDPDASHPSMHMFSETILAEDFPKVRDWLIALGLGETKAPVEYRIRWPDGRVRIVVAEGQPVRDAEGHVTKVAGTLRDITERRLTEQQLQQAQKMEVVGQLTGGMAHDFNNILGAVIGHLDLAAENAVPDSTVAEHCRVALDAALSGAELVKRLVAFARRQALHPRPTDIGAVIANVLPLVERTLGEQIRINTDIGPGLWMAVADTAQIESAILNLIVNARDAMPGGGTLSIEASNVALQEDRPTISGTLPAGDYVLINVSDSGGGMPPTVLARVFEPFFTTKPPGAGSGLGLSMVLGTVQQLGGAVHIDSAVGVGTMVRLYLPRAMAPERSETTTASRAQTPLPTGQEHILLVEDNEQLRVLASDILRDLGYRLTVVESADAAMELIDRGERFDLLFSDVVMPGRLNGISLAQALRARDPSARILFTSGFSSPFAEREQIDVFGAELIGKPYRKADLAVVIRRMLNRAVEPTG